MKKIKKPYYLRGSISQSSVLRFITRASNSRLFLGTPGQYIVTKKNSIAISRAASICASSPISITIAKNSGGQRAAERKTEMLSTTNITENTFDSLKMINSRSLKKLTNRVYSIGQIRTSNSQVLQSPYQGTIMRRIRVSITRTDKMRTKSQRCGNMTGLKHHST